MPKLRVGLNGAAVDGWLAAISTEFSDAEFRILATQLRDEGALVILEVRTSDGDALVRRFENAPEVRSLEVIHTDAQMVLMRFTTRRSKSYNPLRRSKNVSLYPTVLRDGWFTVTLMASHERLTKYADELVAAGIPYRILSLTQSADSSGLLTDRQWQIIDEAIEGGYYETPRRCTITELAAALNIRKSSASRLLHRAESRIINEFAADASGGSER